MHYKKILVQDKLLRKIIVSYEIAEIKKKKHIHLHLCHAVISQQLSTKVADVIYQRFLGLFDTRYPTPASILAIPDEQLRSIGLSNAKTAYVKNLADFFIREKLTDTKLYKMGDEELINYLTQIKGIGRWTVEMILMSCLGREDVFAADDLGIRQTMCHMYALDESNPRLLKAQMHEIAEKWRPYRTYACRYLWGWKDKT